MNRALAAAIAVLGLGGCALIPGAGARDPATTPPATSSSPVRPALPRTVPFTVADDEPARPVKRAAAAYLETLFTFRPGDGSIAAARRRLEARGLTPEPSAAAEPLLRGATEGTVRVIYPQLGGLRSARASVMAVVRLSQRHGDRLITRTRTIDVRLSKSGDDWRVTRLASLGGRAPAPAKPSTLSKKVLATSTIELPDSARWDVQAGRVDDRVLRLLLRLARTHELSVAVFASGHPANVFGDPVTSNHTRGRAVDIWAIDRTRVATYGRESGSSPARTLMKTAIRSGSTEVGGPVAVRGAFTNTLHKDHLHFGFDKPS